MSKTNIDGEVKLKVTEIIFSPVITLLNMVKTKNEVADEDKKLNPNSANKLEAYLAKNLDEIENQVNKKYEKEIKNSNYKEFNNDETSRRQWKVKDIDSTKVVRNNITKQKKVQKEDNIKEDKTR